VTNVAAVARASRRQSITTLGFELGSQDIGAILEVTDVIRCHHHEREVLIAALERVSWQASEVMTVTGPSGVGKTTLVASLQDHARR
jgi:flagellar biosynthesis GTPase FlhF